MAPVRMFIEKFGSEVLIEANHPLAVAQRAKNSANDSAKDVTPAPIIAPVTQPVVVGIPDAASGHPRENESSPTSGGAEPSSTPHDGASVVGSPVSSKRARKVR